MIVAFGTYDKKHHPRIAILIDGLRAHGREVVEINHPLGLSTADRVRMLRQPWRLPALAVRIVSRWWDLARGAWRLKRSGADVRTVLVGYLGHFDVLLARLVFRSSTIVLDHLIFAGDTALDRGARGLRVRLLTGLDRLAIRAADIVAVDTAEHAALLPAGAHGVVVPVGARQEWFDAILTEGAEAGEDADAGAPGSASPDAASPDAGTGVSAVFFGLFTPLQGAAVIAEAAAIALDRGTELSVTMIGTGQDWEAARAALGDRAGVTWVDWVDAAELPAVVARHDISLGVFGTSAKALRVVPNKVYESAAAGCAIITSDTPPQRAMLGDAALLTPPGDAAALAEALAGLAASPEALVAARTAARERAEAFRAIRVVEPLLAVLPPDGRGARP